MRNRMQQPKYPPTRMGKTNRTGHPLCRVKTTGAPAKPGDYLAYWGAWQNKYRLVKIVGLWGASTYCSDYTCTWYVQFLGQYYADGRTKPAAKAKVRPVARQAHYKGVLHPVVPVKGAKLVEHIQATPQQLAAYKLASTKYNEYWLANYKALQS